jgi:3-hydroxyacyl-[acyl-carrier-protein] dehydratase
MRFEFFQMIDRIAALDVGERAVRSVCTVPRESTIFEGHFPTYPLMPGALLLECMAQTCGWLVTAINGFTAMPFLAGVKEAKFRTPVFPGDELEFEGRVIHEGSGYAIGEAKGWCKGAPICDATLTYRIIPYPSKELREGLWEWADRINFPAREYAK